MALDSAMRGTLIKFIFYFQSLTLTQPIHVAFHGGLGAVPLRLARSGGGKKNGNLT